MPTFCRHNRLIQNCPICSREQDVELRPVVSSGTPRVSQPRPQATPAPRAARGPRSRGARGSGAGVTVKRLRTTVDDGYRCSLVPGLKSSAEAERLAHELAFAATRLMVLETEPPGLYGEVAREPDAEERAWLCFLIAYLGPLEDEDPFRGIRSARTRWSDESLPDLEGVPLGPRTAHDPRRGTATLSAYRAWAERAGSQAEAFGGEMSWSPERRFGRIYERLALPGLHRASRFDLLVTHGWLGVSEVRAPGLMLGGDDPVTVAAKRALGIGDPLLLERRAAELARACGLALEALDLGFFNWEAATRATAGMGPGLSPDPEVQERVNTRLGL